MSKIKDVHTDWQESREAVISGKSRIQELEETRVETEEAREQNLAMGKAEFERRFAEVKAEFDRKLADLDIELQRQRGLLEAQKKRFSRAAQELSGLLGSDVAGVCGGRDKGEIEQLAQKVVGGVGTLSSGLGVAAHASVEALHADGSAVEPPVPAVDRISPE